MENLTDDECEMMLCIRYGSMHKAALAYFDETENFTAQEKELIKPYLTDAVEEKIRPLIDKMEAWTRSRK